MYVCMSVRAHTLYVHTCIQCTYVYTYFAMRTHEPLTTDTHIRKHL